MFLSILLIIVLALALVSALRSGGRAAMINSHPYNNPYSDASAARDGRYI